MRAQRDILNSQKVLDPVSEFNPAMAEVSAEHVFSIAMLDVMTIGMTPEQAIDKAFKRIEEIFAKYKMA